MRGETRTHHAAQGSAESGRKGGEAVAARERFAVQVDAVLRRMGSSEDGPLRVTLWFLHMEYVTGQEGATYPLSQIAEGAGLSKDRARTALTNLQGEQWVEPVGRGSWRFIPIRAGRD